MGADDDASMDGPPCDGRRTKKGGPPAKIANRLRPHLVRWRKIDGCRSAEPRAAAFSIPARRSASINRMHDRQPLAGKIRSAWGILEDAGLGDDVVRHSLRHTAATSLTQQGTDHWQAAGWLGTTVEQLEQTYGPHHQDFQGEAAEAFGGRRQMLTNSRYAEWCRAAPRDFIVRFVALLGR
ncbi:hypothetical protein [Bradyrhizobium sp. HKCCYLS2033]|uniref:hypothetical protein n=1 Tax=Bradyrhizobium TaxID=374 RepID=UPI003EB98A0B